MFCEDIIVIFTFEDKRWIDLGEDCFCFFFFGVEVEERRSLFPIGIASDDKVVGFRVFHLGKNNNTIKFQFTSRIIQ